MKERGLMTSFTAANITDSVLTLGLLNQEGWREIGLFGNSPLIASGEVDNVITMKMALVSAFVSAYAYAVDHDRESLKRVTEKTLELGNIAVWAVQVWNILNLAAVIVDNS